MHNVIMALCVLNVKYLQITTFNESPVFLLMDTNMDHAHKDLPVYLYESGERTISHCGLHRHSGYS